MDRETNRSTRRLRKKTALRYSGTEATPLEEFIPPAQTTATTDDDQLYRILLHNMQHGFALCQIHFSPAQQSPEFLIREVNTAFTALSFCTARNLVGKRMHDIFPELAAACRFAAISSGESSKPTHFRIYQNHFRQVFEATITVLDQYRAAIMLVDVSSLLRERQTSAGDFENSFSNDDQFLEQESKQLVHEMQSPESFKGDEQEELQRYKSDLEMMNLKLVQTNTAITVLARQIDRKRDELEKKIARRVSSQLLPLIEELQQDRIPQGSQAKLDVVAAYLRSLTPGVTRGGDIIKSLSPMELRVAMMIKKSFSTEETARMLHLSPETVKTHRRSIRRKLNIRNSPVNLATYLKFNLGPARHSN